MARSFLFIAMTLALAGCDENTTAAPTPVFDHATLNAKYQAVTGMISLPVCATSLQCASVPIGAKPCGGPWRYAVYSKVNVNERELQRRVDDLFAFEREFNRRNGIGSDCSIARQSSPSCVDGMCVDLNVRR